MKNKNNRFSYLESVIASVEDRYDRPNEPRSIHEIALADFGENWADITLEYKKKVESLLES